MSKNKRCDGELIRNLPIFRKLFPYIMKKRNESAILFEQQINVEKTLKYLEEKNEGLDKKRITLFGIFLCAIARTAKIRTELNRFVQGHSLYQRKHIKVSFVSKAEKTDDGKENNVQIIFTGNETLEEAVQKVTLEIEKAKKGLEKMEDDKEMEFFFSFPQFLRIFVFELFNFLDYRGIYSKKMIDHDPLFSSVYVANLGSIGIDAVYHHLYEWGNASIFMVIGKIKDTPVVDEERKIRVAKTLTLKFTFDERITDGVYAARSLEIFKNFVENPELLESKPAMEE